KQAGRERALHLAITYGASVHCRLSSLADREPVTPDRRAKRECRKQAEANGRARSRDDHPPLTCQHEDQGDEQSELRLDGCKSKTNPGQYWPFTNEQGAEAEQPGNEK